MANFKLKADEATAYGVLNMLLASINHKSDLNPGIDHVDLFDYLLEKWMDDLFEERN